MSTKMSSEDIFFQTANIFRGKFQDHHEGYNEFMNPQVFVETSAPSKLKCTFVCQSGKKVGLAFICYRNKSENLHLTNIIKSDKIGRSPFYKHDRVTHEIELKKKGKFVILLCLGKEKITDKFKFSLQKRTSIVQCKLLRDFYRAKVIYPKFFHYFKQVNSEWNSADNTNGGYKSPFNPQFGLRVRQRGEYTFNVQLSQESSVCLLFLSHKGKGGAALTAQGGGKRRVVLSDDEEVHHETDLLICEETNFHVALEADFDYVVLACNGDEHDIEFSVTVVCQGDTNDVEVFTDLSLCSGVSEGGGKKKKKATESQAREVFEGMGTLYDVFFHEDPSENLERYLKSHNAVFVDHCFPPNEESLSSMQLQQRAKIDRFKVTNSTLATDIEKVDSWKRPVDFLESPTLFSSSSSDSTSEKVNVNFLHVIQGFISNCYLVHPLAALAHKYPLDVISLFSQRTINPLGFYVVKLYLEDSWKYVVVDDYFPVDKSNRLRLAKSSDPNELYVAIIEKVFAKILGSYKLMNKTRSAGMPLRLLTGGLVRYFSMGDKAKEELWSMIQRADDRKELIVATTPPKNSKNVDLEKLGIIFAHVYMVVGVFEVESGQKRIVKLRNCWDQKCREYQNLEWNGDFSINQEDADENWTAELKKMVEFSETENKLGVFYMSFDDFFAIYSQVFLCRMTSKEFSCFRSIRGNWKDGKWDKEKRGVLPKIVCGTKNTNTKLILEMELLRTTRDRTRSIQILVAKGIPKLERITQSCLVENGSSKLLLANQVHLEVILEDVGEYSIIPYVSKFIEQDYLITIWASDEIEPLRTLSVEDTGVVSKSIKCKWNPLNPGYRQRINPTFQLHVAEKTEFVMKLERSNKSEDNVMALLVIKPPSSTDDDDQSDYFLFENKEIQCESIFSGNADVELICTLDPSTQPYLLVPSIKLAPSTEIECKIALKGNNTFKLRRRDEMEWQKFEMEGDWNPCEGVNSPLNPQFLIHNPDDSDVYFYLERTDSRELQENEEMKRLGMVLKLLKPDAIKSKFDSSPYVAKKYVFAKSRYLGSKELGFIVRNLPGSQDPYCLIFSLEKALEGSKFKLTTWSSRKSVLVEKRGAELFSHLDRVSGYFLPPGGAMKVKNPHIRLKVLENSTSIMSKLTIHDHPSTELGNVKSKAYLQLCKPGTDFFGSDKVDGDSCVVQVCAESCIVSMCTKNLLASPRPYHLIPSIENPIRGKKYKYEIQFKSTKKVEILPDRKCPTFHHYDSDEKDWNPCGGYLSFQNPCFKLSSGKPCELVFKLKREGKVDGRVGMLMFLVDASSKFGVFQQRASSKEIIGQSEYLIADEVDWRTKIEKGKSYFLYLSLQKPCKGLKFRLKVSAKQPFRIQLRKKKDFRSMTLKGIFKPAGYMSLKNLSFELQSKSNTLASYLVKFNLLGIPKSVKKGLCVMILKKDTKFTDGRVNEKSVKKKSKYILANEIVLEFEAKSSEFPLYILPFREKDELCEIRYVLEIESNFQFDCSERRKKQ